MHYSASVKQSPKLAKAENNKRNYLLLRINAFGYSAKKLSANTKLSILTSTFSTLSNAQFLLINFLFGIDLKKLLWPIPLQIQLLLQLHCLIQLLHHILI